MKFILLLFALFVSFNIFPQQQDKSIGFIENKGQIIDQKGKENKAVLYLLNTSGLNVQLKKSGFSYDVYETKKHLLTKKEQESHFSPKLFENDTIKNPNYNLEYIYHRIDIDFVNSNKKAFLVAEEKSIDYDNYYNVAHAPNGITNVSKYRKVTYKNIYNNIDVTFFIPKDSTKTVEYNFIVKPGGKVSDIQLKFNGVKTELVDNKIKVKVRFGDMEETLPLSWTEDGNSKNEVAIHYKKIKNNVYGFEGVSESSKTIVIDPVPVRLWGTYYAGNNQDFSTDICNDSNNNVYFAGYTGSTTNIATSGSFTVHDYSYFYGNGFITKFSTNGVRIWGVYSIARPKKIKIDTNGNLFYTGEIGSSMPNIATPGAHQPAHVGYYDNAFLIKLNTNGIREWGSYYGGDSSDKGKDICFDALNNVYLVGIARSHNNIGTTNTHQPYHSSGYLDDDGFIVKFSQLGVRIWGTYFGGKENDQIHSCNINNDGFLYVTGNTSSNEDIGTINSFNPNLQGYSSGMIAKFDLNGNRIWGSYFNGERYCNINQSILKDNHLYFFGLSDKQTNMNSSGTFNENFMHLPMLYGHSSFIAKFNINTQNLIWGTYFGEYIQDIDINSNDNLFIHGCTSQTSGIATPGAYKVIPEYSDAYLIKLNTTGQRIWGTYYGGNAMEGTNGAADVNNKISIDSNNSIYLVGNTGSTSGISTPGSHQENHMLNSLGGLYNIYLAKLQDCQSNPTTTSNTPTCIGSTLNLNASGGTNYSWTGPNGFTSNLQNPSISNVNSIHTGQYTCVIMGTGDCDGAQTTNVFVGDTIAPIPNITNLPNITGDCNTIITTIPTALDNCAGTINATTTNPLSYNTSGSYIIQWNYNDGNGNMVSQNQNVIISGTPLPTTISTQTFCIQQNTTLNSIIITGQNIKWYDALTNGNILPNSAILISGTTYYASQTINNCESTRVPVTVNIQNTAEPTGINQSFCNLQNATLNDILISGTAIKWYATNTSSTILNPATLLADGVTYYASQTLNNCESINRTPVTINLINTLNANDFSDYFCDDLNNGNEKIDLTSYKTSLISNTAGNTFSFYKSFSGSQNQTSSEKINNENDYQLNVGTSIIYVRIDNVNTCHQIVELNLTLYSKPSIPIAEVTPICQGNTVTISAGVFDQYLWSTGETSPSIRVNQAGNYSVIVTENHIGINCTSSKDFKVVNSNAATISQVVTNDWTTNDNSIVVLLSNNSVGDYEYSLDGINFQDSNGFSGLDSGEFNVYVRDKNGCGIVQENTCLLMYQKFFTPNGDGFNDTWRIKFNTNQANLIIKIFDRFGKLLKELDNNSEGWNGKFNGQELPSSDYWFTLIRENGKEYKGHFTLKR